MPVYLYMHPWPLRSSTITLSFCLFGNYDSSLHLIINVSERERVYHHHNINMKTSKISQLNVCDAQENDEIERKTPYYV